MIDLTYTEYNTEYNGILSKKEYNNSYSIVWGIVDNLCNGGLFNNSPQSLSDTEYKEVLSVLAQLLDSIKEYLSDDGVLQTGLLASETVGPWSQQFSTSSKYDNVYSLLYAKAELLLTRVSLYRNRCAWV